MTETTGVVPDRLVVDRLIYLMHRIRVSTSEAVGAALADVDLNGTQGLIIESLYELGEVGAAELARRCLVSRQALSAPLDKLEQRGLVSRPASHHSARVRPVSLTAEGRAVAEVARRRVAALETASREIFGTEDLQRFTAMLERYAQFWDDTAEAAGGRRG
ncbi:MarR family winged helix-turn-helix transcriptional regulator [Dactylosporangium sp. CA-092794]|uniref:MarR family winged helix-turn-helix transcriptional regulator n=1 Tax=Dactylosporangium sp. CA-092794 TaxID=3239929 RepID=UPI003D93CA7C